LQHIATLQTETSTMKSHRVTFLMMTTAALLLLSLCCIGTTAREIVATTEWQEVGENDTIPAGMHVRMDLTTGGRWVKLIDENEEDDESKRAAGGADTVEIQSDGSVSAMAVVAQPDKEGGEKKKETMGGLPELPGGTVSSLSSATKEDRKRFETNMKDLWDRRQSELADFQQEMLMDMPKLLKDRIQRLQAYIDDPHTHLVAVLEKKAASLLPDENGEIPADQVEKHANMVTDISSVLLDLEYQMADVDMTRDFHTLGGWPLLVSLLSNDVHKINRNVTVEGSAVAEDVNGVTNLIHRVQLEAAWVIGTAVKNTGEFYPYATEDVTLLDGKSTKTTALQLLVDQLSQTYTLDDGASAVVRKKRQKIVYAMGGLLRGNRVGQLFFLNIDGPSQLSLELKALLDASGTSDMSLAKRILALTGDIVSDVVLHDDQGDHKTIINAFSNDAYCQSCLATLNNSKEASNRSLKETAVRTLQVLAPFCKDWDKETAALSVVKVKQAWQVEPDMDHEVRRELLDLASATVDLIRDKQTD
jgi:hypothetical protein